MKTKVYPHSEEVEQSVLGSVLIDNPSFNKIEGFILEDDFYNKNNQIIFKAMSDMLNSDELIDLNTLSDKMLKEGTLEQIGGPPYLMGLLEATPTSQTITYHASILKDKSNQRKVIHFCQNAFDEWEKIKPFELLTGCEELINSIQESNQQKEIYTPNDLKKQVKEIHETGGLLTGVNMPWSNLSSLCRLRKGLFTVITGSPGSGKSTILDNIILHMAEREQWSTVIYSPENYPLGFHVSSFIEKCSGFPMKDQYTEKASEKAIRYSMEFLEEHITFLQPRKTPTIENIFSLTKLIMKKKRIDCLVIDPFNMLDLKRDSRISETEAIGKFLVKIREFSRRHDMHIFIVAHPRKLQKIEVGALKGNFKPASAYDIMASSNWFNAADYILSIWRDLINPENPTKVYVQKVKFKELGKTGCAKLDFNHIDGKYSDHIDGGYPL